jgi:hypothetical protein
MGDLMRDSRLFVVGTLSAAAVCATGAFAQPKPSELRQQLIGTWSLSEQWVEQDGKKIQRFGASPKGLAIYDQNGRFATILLRTDLPKFASNNAMTGTAEENRAIVQGTNATYGSWSIDETNGSLVSKIDGSTFPGWDGQVQRRVLTIAGNEMKMCVSGAQIGGTACAIWKRDR